MIFITTLSLLVLTTGCGRQYSGVYRGKESVTQQGITPVLSDLTLTLNQSGGDQVSGTWQNSRGESGTIAGRSTGDGLTSVTLTSSSAYSQTGYWQTAGCQQSYTGTLSSPNSNQLTGILVATGGCYGQVGGTSRSIDVSK
jgi:hypothetical protein